MRCFLVLIGLFSIVSALYEDQIGKFDWRKQFVGCPTHVVFDRTQNSDKLIVSTKENVLASLSLNSGEIVWRRVQEQGSSMIQPIAVHKNLVCAISDGGRTVRIWNKKDGALKSQTFLGLAESLHSPSVTVSGNLFVVSANNKVIGISVEDGTKQWEVDTENSDWSTVIPHRDGVAVVGGRKEFDQIHVKWVDSRGMQTLNRILDAIMFDKERVVLSDSYVVGYQDSTLYYLNILADAPNMRIEVESLESNVEEIIALPAVSFVGVRTATTTFIYSLKTGFKQVMKLPYASDSLAAAETSNGPIVMVASQTKQLNAYSVEDGKELFNVRLNDDVSRAPISQIYLTLSDNECQALVVSSDCRMDHLVIDVSRSSYNLEWTREEGLARISCVEMLDLPLSESQAAIETEFSDEEGNMVSSFARRILSQADQLKRWLTGSVNTLFSVGTLIQMRTSSFSQLLDSVRSAAKSSSALRGQPLERDGFNLHKLIVATSLDGTVFGLDNADGRVVWRLYLGDGVRGLLSITGEEKMPILVQRTTAIYNLDAQVAVAYKDSFSGQGRLVRFNPMNGEIVERTDIGMLKRVDLLPFTGENHLHSVITITEDGNVSLFPTLSTELAESAPPLHLMDVSITDGELKGYGVDLVKNRLVHLWSSSLNLPAKSKLVAVHGKPANQRTHSQGRVMIDRSVLYKYVNPNLVAIAILDEESQSLSIFLIDSVSGQTIHSARLGKASGPVHLVHCENWIAYSYWSEKGRRTELGIIELYEGEELTNTEKFDSLSPTRRIPKTEQSAFIFSQGVRAMAVSETEQGLSHRSLLVALPFGNVFEVSRRLLDAMRPLEITAEMREEGGFIPYIPEIPIATEDVVNYNQTIYNVKGIKTASSGLESTSLVLIYGLDLFYTRLTPSGTFDILKDDFDHVLISLVLVALIVGSYICRKLSRNYALKQQWA